MGPTATCIFSGVCSECGLSSLFFHIYAQTHIYIDVHVVMLRMVMMMMRRRRKVW